MSKVVYSTSLIYSSFNHDWLHRIRLQQAESTSNRLELLFIGLLLLIPPPLYPPSSSTCWSCSSFPFSFTSSFSLLSPPSALALSALLWHPIYGPLPLAMTHACLALAPTPTSHPFILDPLPTFTFCVFDVFADISKQLSRHVSYRPEFPCHRALLVFGLRLRLCLGLISSH